MRRLAMLLSLLIILLCCGTQVSASEAVYVVKSGDSLWSISRQYNMLVSELKALNNLTSDMIRVGDRLKVEAVSNESSANSGQSASEPPAPGTYYTVKAGDCLWSIASSHGITIDHLKKLNNLKSEALYPGDRLLVSGSPVSKNNPPEVESGSENPGPATEEPDLKETADTSEDNPLASRAGTTILAGEILQKAAQYLGTPYRYGGSNPGGFDCSGFVMYVFKQYGYSLPRSASEQASIGIHVDKKDLIPGDLVFFHCGGTGINHAGIYVGNGNFIHSSSPRSGGVIYSSLVEGYYLKTYVGARRVLR